eukprot:4606524-Amphidinium_carterae.1
MLYKEFPLRYKSWVSACERARRACAAHTECAVVPCCWQLRTPKVVVASGEMCAGRESTRPEPG